MFDSFLIHVVPDCFILIVLGWVCNSNISELSIPLDYIFFIYWLSVSVSVVWNMILKRIIHQWCSCFVSNRLERSYESYGVGSWYACIAFNFQKSRIQYGVALLKYTWQGALVDFVRQFCTGEFRYHQLMTTALLLYSISSLFWILSILYVISQINVMLKFSILASERCAGKTTTQLGLKPLHSTVLSKTSWFKEVTLWRGMGVAVWVYMGVNLMTKILLPSTLAQAYSPWYSALTALSFIALQAWYDFIF